MLILILILILSIILVVLLLTLLPRLLLPLLLYYTSNITVYNNTDTSAIIILESMDETLVVSGRTLGIGSLSFQ